MATRITIFWLLIGWISIGALSACTTPGKNTFSHGDLTMAQIYRMQTGLADSRDTENTAHRAVSQQALPTGRRSARGGVGRAHYTGVVAHPINRAFKLLPNPNIALYIYPHMAHYDGTNVPVPGYSTTFFLYEKNHYALSGEKY